MHLIISSEQTWWCTFKRFTGFFFSSAYYWTFVVSVVHVFELNVVDIISSSSIYLVNQQIFCSLHKCLIWPEFWMKCFYLYIFKLLLIQKFTVTFYSPPHWCCEKTLYVYYVSEHSIWFVILLCTYFDVFFFYFFSSTRTTSRGQSVVPWNHFWCDPPNHCHHLDLLHAVP